MQKEEGYIMMGSQPDSPPISSTMKTARTGVRTASKFRDLLVPSFSLPDNLIEKSYSNNTNNTRDNLDLILQPTSNSAIEFSSFSFSSVLYSTDDDDCDEWVTKIEYNPRDGSKTVGRNLTTTTIIIHPKQQQKQQPLENGKQEEAEEPIQILDDEEQTVDLIAENDDIVQDDVIDVNEDVEDTPNEAEGGEQELVEEGQKPDVDVEDDIVSINSTKINDEVEDETIDYDEIVDEIQEDETQEEPFEEDPEVLAAHLILDKKLKDVQTLSSVTTLSTVAASSDQSSNVVDHSSIELGDLIKRILKAFWQWECSMNECADGEAVERFGKYDEETTLGTSFSSEDDVFTYNDNSTFTSTIGDDGTTSITTGSTRYEDDTLTYNDTMTYNDTLTCNDTLTQNDGSYTIGDRSPNRDFDESTSCDGETLTSCDDVATLGDEEEQRNDVEIKNRRVSNEDSSYGSGSFQSPISDSYRNSDSYQKKIQLGESRSRSLRSNSQFRITLQVPEIDINSKKNNSLSCNKSRSSNYNLINSFIELKSGAASFQNHKQQQQLLLQQRQPQNGDFFTIHDVEEIEHQEAEKREEPEESDQDQPQPVWRTFEANDQDQPQPVWRTFESPPPPKMVMQQNDKSPEIIIKTEGLRSKAVKITVAKTKKTVHNQDEIEFKKPTHQVTKEPENETSEEQPEHLLKINTDCTLPTGSGSSSHSRSRRSGSKSPFRMRHYGRDDEDVDGDDRCPTDGQEVPIEFTKPPYRIAGPIMLVEEDSFKAKKKPALTIDTCDLGDVEEFHASLLLPENVTPIARLRNPVSYDVLALIN